MRYIKRYEENDDELFYIRDAYKNAPNIHFRNKHYNYVTEKLKYLIGKVVNFVSRIEYIDDTDNRKVISTKLHYGEIEGIEYDIIGRPKVYIKLKNKEDWIPVCEDEPIKISILATDMNKYNL